MATVREVLFDLISQLGMTKISAMSGLPKSRCCRTSRMIFNTSWRCRNRVAVAMADAYAQAAGRCAHVNLHTAAGSGNGMGNIETAFYNRTPLIVTAGQHMREMLVNEPYLSNQNLYFQALPWGEVEL